jgi:hypothetical protein
MLFEMGSATAPTTCCGGLVFKWRTSEKLEVFDEERIKRELIEMKSKIRFLVFKSQMVDNTSTSWLL